MTLTRVCDECGKVAKLYWFQLRITDFKAQDVVRDLDFCSDEW